jgi:hypothetical protein
MNKITINTEGAQNLLLMMVEWRMCSRVLHKMEVSEMGR